MPFHVLRARRCSSGTMTLCEEDEHAIDIVVADPVVPADGTHYDKHGRPIKDVFAT